MLTPDRSVTARSRRSPLASTGLEGLMRRTQGDRRVVIGLVDGPVDVTHPGLDGGTRQGRAPLAGNRCSQPSSAACRHGTFTAGVLCGTRTSVAPGISPRCRLRICPIFAESAAAGGEGGPAATERQLAEALLMCIAEGARLVNLSVSLTGGPASPRTILPDVLRLAREKGVLVLAAAGNDGTVGSTPLTGDPWVIPVVATDAQRRPLPTSTLSAHVARRGLAAPGMAVRSLGPEPEGQIMGGSSVATAVVTGAVALLWSLHPEMTAAALRAAIAPHAHHRRLTPPFLDVVGAWERIESMSATAGREGGRSHGPQAISAG